MSALSAAPRACSMHYVAMDLTTTERPLRKGQQCVLVAISLIHLSLHRVRRRCNSSRTCLCPISTWLMSRSTSSHIKTASAA